MWYSALRNNVVVGTQRPGGTYILSTRGGARVVLSTRAVTRRSFGARVLIQAKLGLGYSGRTWVLSIRAALGVTYDSGSTRILSNRAVLRGLALLGRSVLG